MGWSQLAVALEGELIGLASHHTKFNAQRVGKELSRRVRSLSQRRGESPSRERAHFQSLRDVLAIPV
jgi:hypothetical protein